LSLAARTAAAALALCACDKIDYIPPDPVEGWPTKVLMHRGGGDGSPCPQNTLPAVRYGASRLDGVEIDIEISASGTLWLGHDNEVLDCDGVTVVGCFSELDDAAIDELYAYCYEPASDVSCQDPSRPGWVQHYVRLDDVFAAISVEHPDALYALDIKGQYCGAAVIDRATEMADEVARLVGAHDLGGKVLAESSQQPFLERLVGSGAPVYGFVVALEDIDGPLSSAERLGATGISFKYAPTSEPLDASVVAGIHGVGHRIIVWTIDTPEDIAAVWAMQPDVIETDNAEFMRYVSR
jgi:glycerophosphoryl diester phosphodiesterase